MTKKHLFIYIGQQPLDSVHEFLWLDKGDCFGQNVETVFILIGFNDCFIYSLVFVVQAHFLGGVLEAKVERKRLEDKQTKKVNELVNVNAREAINKWGTQRKHISRYFKSSSTNPYLKKK